MKKSYEKKFFSQAFHQKKNFYLISHTQNLLLRKKKLQAQFNSWVSGLEKSWNNHTNINKLNWISSCGGFNSLAFSQNENFRSYFISSFLRLPAVYESNIARINFSKFVRSASFWAQYTQHEWEKRKVWGGKK